jgi:hypothetical protein
MTASPEIEHDLRADAFLAFVVRETGVHLSGSCSLGLRPSAAAARPHQGQIRKVLPGKCDLSHTIPSLSRPMLPNVHMRPS